MLVRSVPVLEGEVARRFERKARKAEKNRGKIKLAEKEKESFKKTMAKARL
jgi:hypothetical protein